MLTQPVSLATGKCLIWQQLRPVLSLQYGTIPWGDELVIWRQVEYIGFLIHCKNQWFMLTGTNSYSGYGLPLLISGPQLLPLSNYRVLIDQHGIPQNNKQSQRNYFKAKVIQPWAHAHGFHWACYILYYPKTTNLVGVMEGADETPAWIMEHHPWWYKTHPKSTSVTLFWVNNIYSHGHKN